MAEKLTSQQKEAVYNRGGKLPVACAMACPSALMK